MKSVNAADYQDIPRDVAVMEKQFASGEKTGWHSHQRAQVLFAAEGLMFASTAAGSWAVPTDHALLIPAGLEHSIAMHGPVRMQTAYIPTSVTRAFPEQSCRVVGVSQLLRAVLGALALEPVLYDVTGRGLHLSSLVLDEIERARDAPLALPMPQNPHLRSMCQQMIDRPDLSFGLDQWADEVAMSRRTLTRRFRAETGFSFVGWRRRLRMLQALILQTSGCSTIEAANRVGFRKAQSLMEK